MRAQNRMSVYESPLHERGALVRPAGAAAVRKLLLVGGRSAALLAPLLLVIAVEHGCELTVYTRPDYHERLPALVRLHVPDVVLVESEKEPPSLGVQKVVWLPAHGATTAADYAAWAAQAWRRARGARTLPVKTKKESANG